MIRSSLARWGSVLVLVALSGRAPLHAEEAPASNPPPQAAAAKPVQHFDILEFEVQGNTVLDTETIEQAVYPFMGEQQDINAVEGARAALEKAYHDAGYGTVGVDIPPQKVQAGVVELKVVQGTVSKLRVVGSRYFSQGRILDAVPELAPGKVPNLNEVQKELAQATVSPGDERITPLLRPGKDPDTTEVDLEVEDHRPLHGSLEIDNAHAPDTDALRLNASLRYTNLFQRGHTIGFQYEVSPQDIHQVQVYIATYSMPAGPGTLLFTGVDSKSTTFADSNIGIFSNGDVLGLRYILPMMGDDPVHLQQSLTWGADWKNSGMLVNIGATSTGGSDGTGTPASSTTSPVHYLPFSMAYTRNQDDQGNLTTLDSTFTFGVRDFGSQELQFANKRFLAHSNFAYLKLGGTRTQQLPGKYSLYLLADGQLAGSPLISNEQFVVGGEDTVRGYLESTSASDSGLRTTIELRSPNVLEDSKNTSFNWLQGRVFYDSAWMRTLSPLPGSVLPHHLAGIGAGLTAKTPGGVEVRGDVAMPLVSAGEGSTAQPADRVRVHASANVEF